MPTMTTTDRLVQAAREFAVDKHGNQKRKSDGAAYIVHLEGVAGLLIEYGYKESEMIAAALLHDTVEDTDTTIERLAELFGETVAQLVYWLTDTEQGSRRSRNMQSAWRLSRAPLKAKLIKLADIIDNGSAIRTHDVKAAPAWLDEKRQVLRMMAEVEGSRIMTLPLFQRAVTITDQASSD
jgi:(p)ppGpp synthase/HD superfamily hydrolase